MTKESCSDYKCEECGGSLNVDGICIECGDTTKVQGSYWTGGIAEEGRDKK